MKTKAQLTIWTIFVVFVLCLNLAVNVNTVHADDAPPTEPPAATEVPIELPTEEATLIPELVTETPTPLESDLPGDALAINEEAPASELLAEMPENTQLVVLDENGDLVSLASQEAIVILEEADPMWCPQGVLPNGPGCTTNLTVTNLLTLMRTNAGGVFSANGVIYFERSGLTTYNGAFILDDSLASLGASYNTLKAFNITLRGGWNGGATSTFHATESSVFDNNNNAVVRVGSNGNPWVGSVSLQDILVQDNDGGPGPVSVPGSLAVYTTTGNITLNDVDIDNQADGQYTAYLNSTSGNINVQNGSTFDGAGPNQGFFANTNTGTITITGTAANRITFTDAEGSGPGTNYNGATLSAPTVSLTYMTADGNDLNGIQISNANTITLNNVISTNNGTSVTGPNLGSGVRIFGTGTTTVNVLQGTYSNNERYGIEMSNVASITTTGVTMSGNGEGNIVNDSTAPTISPTVNCSTPGNAGWCRGTITINWNVSDAQSAVNTTGCQTSFNTNTPPAGTTLSCSATSTGGTTNSSIVVLRDGTAPNTTATKSPPPNGQGWNNTNVTVTFTGTDVNSGLSSCTAPVTITTDGSNQSATGSCTDVAGNTSNATANNINIDRTAPTVSANLIPAPNGNGWNNSGVLIIFQGNDNPGGSGVPFGGCSPLFGGSNAQGANQTSSSTCTDRAGNSASLTVTFNIDLTNPVATATKSPAPNANGWNNSDVVVTFTGTDTPSGIASCTPAATVSTEGSNQSRSGSCTDLAGRVSNIATANNINIDKTPPVITFVSRTPANGNGWNNGNVIVNWSCTDSRSGVVSASVSQTVSAEGANQSTTGTCQDLAGNIATNTQSGINIDKTAPTLSLANVTVEATGPAGANVNYSALASDNLDASPTLNCLPASGGIYPFGTTAVTCTATDDAGNTSAPNSFNITVVDTTPPTIDIADMTVHTFGIFGKKVTYPSPDTLDIVDGAGVATCTPVSGNFFVIGNNHVTCTATDAHGNTSTASFKITVEEAELTIATNSGFFIPATGGSSVNLDCVDPNSFNVNMAGARIIFNNLCGYEAFVNNLQQAELPGELTTGFEFIDGYSINISKDGKLVTSLPKNASVVIEFNVPNDQKDADLGALYWNGSQWIEIAGEMTDGGHFTVNVTAEIANSNTFIFVTK